VNERHRPDQGKARSLTGAISQCQFFDIATAEVARAKRHRNPLSCLVIDIDRFDSIDDKHGHGAEDLPLQHFVSVCRSTLRASDYIGRIGGDEFAIMLPETPLLSALGVAERILENLAASANGKWQHHMTAATSIGVAEYDDQTRSLDQLLQAAAMAMIDAKQNGQNQAVCYLDDLQLTSTAAIIN
jgi:diguanylate cyclase (GGDEF)-like protein